MSDEHFKILLVEDNPDGARMVREMLAYAKGAPFNVECVDRLSVGHDEVERVSELFKEEQSELVGQGASVEPV